MTLARAIRVISISTIFVLSFAVVAALSPAMAAVCGNAVVEAGEDCDDGSGTNGTTNSCCSVGCTFSGKAPDVIVGDLTGTSNWGTIGSITAYSVGTTSCNLGSCWLNWIANSANKPIIGQNLYRLKNGRFEQIGQSWLKHAFTALQGNVCSNSCNSAPNGSHLGVNCSDPYGAGLNGDQTRLGPKSDVNPNSGVYLFPDSRINTSGDAIFKRLQAHTVDIDPAQNAGALYFVEGQYVTLDDAQAKNNANNASYRSATISSGTGFPLSLTGSTQRGKMAIQAWKVADPTVTETLVSASEGIFVMSAKATSLGGGIYHYEYAVENLTNNRSGQSFTVPLPPGTVVTNVGFHDVDYHSGEPFDGTDWTSTIGANSVSWATTTFDVNPNANALRWGTLYNFRFDANVAPGFATITIGLFKPGAGSSGTVTSVAPNPCVGAANGTACSDGSLCTLNDSCQSGVCQGATPVVCNPSDSCHLAGTCSPDTGFCSTGAAAPNGTGCTDGNGCTQTDTCQSGVCIGSNPRVCTASDQCHLAGTCSAATGACSNPLKSNGSPCNDANFCTQTDTCQLGACSGSNPVVCTASDQCHVAGTCNSGTGACSNPAKPDGSVCSDGNGCTQTDTCVSGACAGDNPVVCAASDACHLAGTCSPGTGQCSNPAAPDGTGCSDADACTSDDACQGGVCAGANPVVCTASDSCHDAGTCAPETGVCSNPASPDGIGCSDGNVCTANDSCHSGVCSGDGPASPSEVDNGVMVTQIDGVTTITWSSAVGSTSSNILRGLVSALPVGPGGDDEICLMDGTANLAATDLDSLDPDQAFWYLIQGVNDCGKGPFGFQVQDGSPTARASTTCP